MFIKVFCDEILKHHWFSIGLGFIRNVLCYSGCAGPLQMLNFYWYRLRSSHLCR